MHAVHRITRTSCRGCHGFCQVLVHTNAQGRVIKITGDKESPVSRGFICPKGAYAADLLYHPDRITQPLRRTHRRGRGAWEPISWDAAIDLMVERFDTIRKQDGPEYIAIAQGTGRPYMQFTGLFCNALGSPNFVSPAHNCHVPRIMCAGITMGWFPNADIFGHSGAMPRCVMILGNNTVDAGGAGDSCGKGILRALKHAEKSIAIDPRATAVARQSSLHLALRPGTEGALLLAMIHTIIRDKAYDAAFVRDFCFGFEDLARHVQPFSPQWAAPITRLSAEKIEEAALTFARCRPACILWGNGIDESVCAFQTSRSALILMAICGTLDIPGGMVDWVPPAGIRPKPTMQSGLAFLSDEQKKNILSPFPFCPGAHPPTFWQACVSGKPYRPKAIWIIGANPILTHTRGDIIQKALRDHLEFVVVSDFFITPTAAVADLVLPPQHWLEQEDVMQFGKFWCAVPRKRITLIGEARDDREVIIQVARRLGLEEAFPWKDWRDHLAWLVEPSGLSFDQFLEQDIVRGEMRHKKYETEGFNTPSGKVELYSSIMEKMGLPPLPEYREPPLSPVSTPELAGQYPFILLTGCKMLPFFHTEGMNIPSLRKLHPRPHVDMNPEAAKEQGFTEGQRVCVSTPHGTQEFFLHMDDRLEKDVVHVEHGWWFAEQAGPDYGCFTSNVNLLFSHEYFDQISGAEPLKCGLCRIDPL